MYKIVEKRPLSRNITLMQIEAPLVAKKAQPGQFVILRATKDGERIPLTISGTDIQRGTVCIIFQIVGATTRQLNTLEKGDSLADFAGPLGKPTELDGLKKVCVVGGETKFACVDGPDFDGFKVDFDEAMKRTAMYRKFERHAYEATCNLLNKEVQ